MSEIPMRAFAQSLPMALMRARESVMRVFRPVLASHGLSEQQWRVLRALASAEDGLAVGELADRTFLLGPSLSRILANLERRRLVDRTIVSDDLRRSRITISAVGLELVRAVAPESEAHYARIEASFGPQRMAGLYELLEDLAILGTDTASETRRTR